MTVRRVCGRTTEVAPVVALVRSLVGTVRIPRRG